MVRWKNVLLGMATFQMSQRAPSLVKRFMRRGIEKMLPRGYDVATHFTPSYDPWDQRLCLVPDGDLFKAISAGKASIVTDHIETFTETGLRLKSGATLDADIVITATGLNLLVIGGMKLSVDGAEISLPDTVGYKGMMLSGVPNFAMALGYTNASWTLKCDLVAEYVCRLLQHMDARGYAKALPLEPDASVGREPFLGLSSGYIQRALGVLPKQGTRTPWRLHQNYIRDLRMFRHASVEDEAIAFSRLPAAAARPVRAAVAS
jgi:cation diffusion facilitator CzcD-associated flavoprotein CzcO